MEIISNNSDILLNNSRIRYNIKTIALFLSTTNDENIINELKMKMPKLNSIKLFDYSGSSSHNETN